ncbi:MAG: hypothetical protein WD801_06480 [Gemmatimonadaceae bacterium]
MRLLGLALVSCVALAAPAGAQRVAVEALADIELWETDDSSRLLARNDGRALLAGRLHVWLAARLAESLELRALGMGEAGTGDEEADASLQLLSLRYGRSRAFVAEGGKILYPIGAFAARRFSNTNPLIGAPDLYAPQYPEGVVLSGASGPLDYRAAAVSLPLVNPRYTPKPGRRIRPVAGVGVSAGPGFRVGVAATRGPYLSEDLQALLPPGAAWKDFGQLIIAADARYSAGYIVARAEAAWSSYEVPTVADVVKGFGWYGEIRGTVTPRLFVAARYENSKYAFIRPVSPSFWVGSATRQINGEIGAGYRFSPDALLKTSFRRDHWPVQTSPSGARFPDGYALAVQFSQRVDVMGLLEGKY